MEELVADLKGKKTLRTSNDRSRAMFKYLKNSRRGSNETP